MKRFDQVRFARWVIVRLNESSNYVSNLIAPIVRAMSSKNHKPAANVDRETTSDHARENKRTEGMKHATF